MLGPKHERYADRMQSLIEQAQVLKSTRIREEGGRRGYIQDKVGLNAWLMNVWNVVELAVGRGSPHFVELERIKELQTWIEKDYQVEWIEGILAGALDDLKSGMLVGQEFLIAGQVFDSVLEQARHLNGVGHKDAAAVLARVVIEDALRRLSRQAGIADDQSASVLNDELKKAGRYVQSQWRQIQAWLDIGNDAAHGHFEKYDDARVASMIDEIEGFLAREFSQ